MTLPGLEVIFLSRPLTPGSWALVNTELCAPFLPTAPAFLFLLGCWGERSALSLQGSPRRAQLIQRDVVPNLVFASLGEPLTSVTVHWNVITAISSNTSVSFRFNVESDDLEDRETGKRPSSVLPLFSFLVLLVVGFIALLVVAGWVVLCLHKHRSPSRNSFSSTTCCSKGMWELGLALVVNVFIFSA